MIMKFHNFNIFTNFVDFVTCCLYSPAAWKTLKMRDLFSNCCLFYVHPKGISWMNTAFNIKLCTLPVNSTSNMPEDNIRCFWDTVCMQWRTLVSFTPLLAPFQFFYFPHKGKISLQYWKYTHFLQILKAFLNLQFPINV